MDQIKRKAKPTLSLKDTAKAVREMTNQMKTTSTDTSLEFLVRQHSRTHYIAFAFVRALEDEIGGQARSHENLQQILLNALDYIKKNLKCFSEIMDNQSGKQAHKSSKKDLNSNPFGVMGPTRNSSNKENYGGNSNTTAKNIGSKSEKKMFIKQNIQIALAFLKKICRLNKTNQDKFRDMLSILNQIESGT